MFALACASLAASGGHPSHSAQRSGSTGSAVGAAVVSSMASIAKSVVLPVQSKLAAGWDEAKHATTYTAGVLHNITSAHPYASTRTKAQEPPSKHTNQRPSSSRAPPKPTPRQQPRSLAAQNRSTSQQHGSSQRGVSPGFSGAPIRWSHLPAAPPAPLPPPLALPPPRPPPPPPAPWPASARPTSSVPELARWVPDDPRPVHNALAKDSVSSAPTSVLPRPTEPGLGSTAPRETWVNQTLVEGEPAAQHQHGADNRATSPVVLPNASVGSAR